MPIVPPVTAPGIVTMASPYSVAETFSRLEAAVQAKGLTVFAHIDHRAGAVGVGLDMQEARVLIFGTPKGGTPLMVASPLVALDLPLRLLVWQDTGDRTWVSYQSAAYLTERYSLPKDLEKNISWIDALVSIANQR